ncbi:YjgN family protein [Uliginosibacterium sp. H1]|uniref:YjgN family protein n=1 Tax=Uliginosibacterium sp. H1 TaxID=3114757 RepID=UPI002E18F455|nr:YjgN family protein [Uliginosibacterium sp. H1]
MDLSETHDAVGNTQEYRLSFTGSGGDYFRIWIVNLLLSICTLGIYSAWAKVRRLQYFHRNTLLAGSGFDYHGNPVGILKGRLLVFGIFVIYQVAGFSGSLGLVYAVLGLVFLISPWMIRQALRFRAWNTSYRGLRFHFAGTLGEAFRAYVGRGLATAITLGLAAPWAMQGQARYKMNNLFFGQSNFEMTATVGDYYKVFLKILGLMLLALAISFGAIFLSYLPMAGFAPGVTPDGVAIGIIGVVAFYFVVFFLIGPYAWSRLLNLVWNNSTLGRIRFVSTVRARGLLWISLTNLLGLILTLGFYWPWAVVRLARYRAEHTALLADGGLDDFLAHAEQDVGATGEEAADWLDLDLGL